MANLTALTPLGQDAPQVVTVGPLTITENVGVAMASLASRSGREAEVAAIAAAHALPLPGPGQSAQAAVYGAIWLGPEQWMVLADFASHEDITAILKPLFAEAASLTEQTDAWVRFDLASAELPTLFERLCAFDLAGHATGSATRTVIEHLGCYVVKHSAGLVSVIGPRSSAPTLHHALVTAAKSAF